MSSNESTTPEKQCPRCGSALIPIVYGFPGVELFEAAERGEVVLGGCTVYEGMPASRCTECGRDVGSRT